MAKPDLRTRKYIREYKKEAARLAKELRKEYKRDIQALEQELKFRLKEIKLNTLELERAYVKDFRHDLAALRRQGIVNKKISARNALPTQKFENIRQAFASVIKGEVTARKITRKKRKALKEIGFTDFVNGRALVNKQFAISPKGKIVQRKIPQSGLRMNVIRRIKIGPDLEERLDDYFDKLKPGQMVAFSVHGHKSYEVYTSPDPLRRRLYAYEDNMGGVLDQIELFEIDDFYKYAAEKRREVDTRKRAKERKRYQRRKQRRNAKRNMRHK